MPYEHLTPKQLAEHIAIIMAAHGKDAPILRGSRAPTRDQRDELRQAFAKWLAEAMIRATFAWPLADKQSNTSLTR